MKLFISYSRDDKSWVYEFWRDLRDSTNYDIWLDQRITPAADWWATILDKIEWCDCFISILTPRCVESIFCNAELEYAVALNKPILPLMLKPCNYPSVLNTQRVQYENIAEMGLDKVLVRAMVGLSQVHSDTLQGRYPSRAARRPDVPTPANKPEHIYEIFASAEEAAGLGNESLAEQLFEQVIKADPKNLGLAARERLTEMRVERDRATAYLNIVRLAGNPTTHRGAAAAWRVYVNQYGRDHDPNGLAPQLENSTPAPNPPPSTPKPVESKPKPTPPPPAPAKPSKKTLSLAEASAATQAIIGSPFEWCEVPAGPFLYGDDKRKLELPTFWIAKYPITYSQFQAFVEAKDGITDERWWEGLAANADARKLSDPSWKIAKHPREKVNWYQCMAFARWLSYRLGGAYASNQLAEWVVRLPLETEWEKAARGTDGRKYPWGNGFDKSKCNTSESGLKKTTPVDQYPQGASPYGVFDMSGNVWEWFLNEYDNPDNIDISNSNRRVLRGGSWSGNDYYARAARRYFSNPSDRDRYFGGRVVCVRPPSP